MPVYIVGIVCAAIGYALMSYLMTATPLQVVNVARLGTSANATIIQWHVVAMFLPSFFTGNLIAKFGVARVLWSGVLFYLATIILALAADGFWLYWFALVTLGLGWNFLYIGGSSLIARVAEPVERGRVQGFGDLMTTTTVAIASLTAGAVHSQYGWEMMSQVAILPVGVVILALLWMAITQRRHGALNP
jgi:MFS family permease